MKGSYQLNIKVKAFKKWNQEPVLLKPVFFMFYKGFEWREVSGYGKYSYFATGHNDYIFGTWAKCKIWFIWRLYWGRNVFWRRIRYAYPHRLRKWIKSLFQKKVDTLPF